MSLQTRRYLGDSKETPLVLNTEAGWRAIGKGLNLVAGGYLALMAGGALGALLFWAAGREELARRLLHIQRGAAGAALVLSALVFGVTALVGFGMVLAGYWHCLHHAPSHRAAKEVMYVCFNGVIGAVFLVGPGLYLSGAHTFTALASGSDWAAKLNFLDPGVVLQLAGLLLGLLSGLVFNHFLGTVAACFADRTRAASAEYGLLFVGLLVGATAGGLACAHRLGVGVQVGRWLAVGWLACFVWHIWLVLSVRESLIAGVRRHSGIHKTIPRADAGSAATHTLSGLHRMIQRGGA